MPKFPAKEKCRKTSYGIRKTDDDSDIFGFELSHNERYYFVRR